MCFFYFALDNVEWFCRISVRKTAKLGQSVNEIFLQINTVPIVLDAIVLRRLLRAEVHAVVSSFLFEKDGTLRTNALARLINKDLHVVFFYIDEVDRPASTSKHKWEGLEIKARKGS